MKILICLFLVLYTCTGCRTHRLTQQADGALEYRGSSLFTKTQAVEIQKTADGFVIKGYSADANTAAMSAVAEGAARGAAAGVKP